jgi:hypothetical protein
MDKIKEIVKEFFVKFPLQHTTSLMTDEDFFLAYLWLKGYKIVPIINEYVNRTANEWAKKTFDEDMLKWKQESVG